MIDRKKSEHFESLDKNTIIKNVYLYIDAKLKWKRIDNIDNPFDFIKIAIEKMLDGTYKWDPETDPDPTRFLMRSTWRDIVNELRKRSKNKLYNRFSHPEDFADYNEMIGNYDSEIEGKETMLLHDEIWLQMKEAALEENEKAWLYLETMEEMHNKKGGVPKRAEIAEHLEWEVSEVTNVMKWIQRHFSCYLQPVSMED